MENILPKFSRSTLIYDSASALITVLACFLVFITWKVDFTILKGLGILIVKSNAAVLILISGLGGFSLQCSNSTNKNYQIFERKNK